MPALTHDRPFFSWLTSKGGRAAVLVCAAISSLTALPARAEGEPPTVEGQSAAGPPPAAEPAVFGPTLPPASDLTPSLPPVEPTPARGVPFAEGERLTYDLLVMGAKAGTGVLTVGKPRKYRGRKVLPLLGTMKSATFFDNVYKVRDTMLSLMVTGDKTYPMRTEFQSERENVQRDYHYDFDARIGRVKGNRVRIDAKGKRTEKRLEARVPPYSQDVMSWIYYLRTVEFEDGAVISFKAHSGNFLYSAKCTVEKTENIWTRMGHMDAKRIKMVVDREGTKEPNRREATVWYSMDAERLPLRITFEFSLGKGEAILTDYQAASSASSTAKAPE